MTKREKDSNENKNQALISVIKNIRDEPERIWNSLELLEIYRSNGGTESNTTRFLTCIQEEMTNEIYMFRCNDLSTIVMMKGKAAGIFKLGFENESDDQILQEVATEIKAEIKETSSYNINDNYPKLDYDLSLKSCSPTLMKLLSMISPKLNNTLRSVMIGNLITSGASNGTTMLQVSLGAIEKNNNNRVPS